MEPFSLCTANCKTIIMTSPLPLSVGHLITVERYSNQQLQTVTFDLDTCHSNNYTSEVKGQAISSYGYEIENIIQPSHHSTRTLRARLDRARWRGGETHFLGCLLSPGGWLVSPSRGRSAANRGMTIAESQTASNHDTWCRRVCVYACACVCRVYSTKCI